MAGESASDPGQGQAESPIDELIRAILQEAGGSSAAWHAAGTASAASLLEAALDSTLASPSSSPLEKVLVAQAFGSALAHALAQELADSLAPRLMKQVEQILAKHLEQVMSGQAAGRGRPGAADSNSVGSGRKAGS